MQLLYHQNTFARYLWLYREAFALTWTADTVAAVLRAALVAGTNA